MAAFAMAVVAVLLFAFGMVLGVRVGEHFSAGLVTRADYWKANAATFGIGVVASALIWATGFTLLVGVAFGLMVGVLSGLKMGFGESIGPWGAVDSKLGTNKDQVRRAKDPQRAEAVRRARKEGTPEPTALSVEDEAAAAGPGSAGASSGASGRASKGGSRRGGRRR
ncbi:MAG: hypothetical protein ACI360_08395 [Atopobiaceae bacterium]